MTGQRPSKDETAAAGPGGIDAVTEASIDSFPASDPPSWTPVAGPKVAACPVRTAPGNKQARLALGSNDVARAMQLIASARGAAAPVASSK